MAYIYTDFCVGEEVVIRDWDDMAEEFNGGDEDRDIQCRSSFTTKMRYLCGEHAVITSIYAIYADDKTACVDVRWLNESLTHPREWSITTDMIRKLDGLSYKGQKEKLAKEKEAQMEEILKETTYDFDKATNDAMELFKWCGYVKMKDEAVRSIITQAFVEKTALREVLRKHPNWNEEQQAIIFTENYQAGIDRNHLEEAINWFKGKVYDAFAKLKVDFDSERFDTLRLMKGFAEEYSYDKRRCLDYVLEAIRRQAEEIEDEYCTLRDRRNNLSFSSEVDGWLEKRTYTELCDIITFLRKVNNATDSFVNSNILDYANEINSYWKLNAKEGQKLSRVVSKVLTHYGINEIKDMKTIVHNGVTEPKDFGYNYYFAMFGDAINPVSFTKYTVISINPLDYWTMSFGKNWSSCQTIDKLNRRVSKKTYHGQYSSGTESYMLDGSSVIFYTVDASYQGEMWKADKERRMMFHLAPNGKAMIFGRQYPDARDDAETGISAQFRNVMQKILSDALSFNNLWKVYKGTEYGDRYSITSGTHYRDYNHYEDCGISFVTDEGMPKIKIGHKPICPSCGKEHTNEECVFCYDHTAMKSWDGDHECPRCGEVVDISSSEAVYCPDNGGWYCNYECAEDDDVYFCSDDSMYHTSANRYYDEYDETFYHNREGMVEVHIDGDHYTFRSMRNANEYGFYLNDNDEWERRD